jgi:RHS repeat-associated protein
LNRIQQANSTGPNWGETFTIDAWGNLTSRGPVAGKTNYEALNAPATVKNQLTGFGYDAAGNMISNGTATYSYDGENRLTTAGGYTYTYDGDGRRVKRQSGLLGIVSWPDLSGRTLDESGLTGTMVREYVFFNGQRVARRDAANNAVHYFFSDHLGSTSLVTNATGTMAACAGTGYVSGEQETDYYPYGGEYPPFCSTISDQKFKFTGKERDSETGLDYFGARYYGSNMGRMLSPDSGVDQHPDDPQSWNLYAYARNNPIVLVDPTGEYVCGKSMSSDQCTDFQNGLDKAQEAANAAKEKYGADSKQYKDAQAAIDAYGKAGADNGVTIEVGNTGKYAAKTFVSGSIGPKTADNPTGQKITVRFNATGIGNAMDESHEGVHVQAGSAWVASGFSNALNPTKFQTELNAYRVSATIGEGLGYIISTVTFNSNKYVLAVRNWDPANTDIAIKNILKREYNLLPGSKVKAFQRNTSGGGR